MTTHTDIELSQARAALARARRTGDTAAASHLTGIVGNLTLIARAEARRNGR